VKRDEKTPAEVAEAVAVCSIDALKQMKQVAGRPRDQVDLEDLDATAG